MYVHSCPVSNKHLCRLGFAFAHINFYSQDFSFWWWAGGSTCCKYFTITAGMWTWRLYSDPRRSDYDPCHCWEIYWCSCCCCCSCLSDEIPIDDEKKIFHKIYPRCRSSSALCSNFSVLLSSVTLTHSVIIG